MLLHSLDGVATVEKDSGTAGCFLVRYVRLKQEGPRRCEMNSTVELYC